jgi:hypothetical protein
MDDMKMLAEARLAGLTVRAEGGRLIVRGPRRLEAMARRLLSRKAELLKLLPGADETPGGTLAESDADEAAGRYYYPPSGTPLYFQDEAGRPCSRGEAYLWTWEGAPSWFHVSAYPVPPIATHDPPARPTDADA